METQSPWPSKGWFEIRLRKAAWVLVEPIYNENGAQHSLDELTTLFFLTGWFPFVTFFCPWFHFYIGFKPISMEDPAFFWRDMKFAKALRDEGTQFVQLSARWGLGDA